MRTERRRSDRHETKEDEENEKRILKAMAAHMGCDFEWLSETKHIVDGVLHLECGRLVGIVEAKKRSHKAGKYPTVILSTHKATEGVRQSKILRVPFYFAVEFENVGGYLEITEELLNSCEIKMAGMKGRNDTGDYEPCYMLPLNSSWKRYSEPFD